MDTVTGEIAGKPSGAEPPTASVSTFSAPNPSSTRVSSVIVKPSVCAPLVRVVAGMVTVVAL